MKKNSKIIVAVIGGIATIVAALISHSSTTIVTKDNNVVVGRDVAVGNGNVVGDHNTIGSNNTQNFYIVESENAEHVTMLIPNNLPTPKNYCDNFPQARISNILTILLGNNTALADAFPHTILEMAGEPILVVDKE